jgi:hypothetical protein
MLLDNAASCKAFHNQGQACNEAVVRTKYIEDAKWSWFETFFDLGSFYHASLEIYMSHTRASLQ